MRVGITLLTDLPWAEARPRWQAAEELGFDHAWTYDHLVWGGLPDAPWTTSTPVLGAAAQVTTRIGLGTLVASPNFRHPYQLFRDAQALEDLSDGRFLLGVGTGGDLDSRVLGQADLTTRERVDRFQELTDTLLALRDGDHVSREGRWFSLADARTLPPLRRTPVVVAANGPRSLRYAARVGDGWVTTGAWGGSLEEWWSGLATAAATYAEALAEAGRDPQPRYLLTDSTDRFALSSRSFFEDVAGRAAELGFTDLVTHWPRDDSPYAGDVAVLEEVATEVLPGLR
ncbi:LLM class flavin-dependent oxidoreductase [Nocardioides litoris]|uniref:LLM class flavin-dependent oxidoreductase n=1 Tax=Nocardioides litoris TaxID=1926648 RepID=UPI001120260D|nr:LLM class flavin-dependent oxidoreductase [Nocardioides litoris]